MKRKPLHVRDLLDTTEVGQLIPIILIILTNKRVNLFRHNL